MPTPPGLLVIAHGTRDARGAQEMDVLLGLLRARWPAPVAHAWLEDFAAPGAVEAVGPLVAAGVQELVVVPFLNFAAGHARYDVPEQVAAVRAEHPALDVYVADVLGVHPCLLEAATRRVNGVCDARDGEVLVVAASGSSDPRANGDVAKAARMLGEATGHRWVEIAFAGVTWPATDEVLARAATAGARRAVVFSWSLLAGLLEQRVRTAADAAPLPVAYAGRFGPDPLVADAVVARAREALPSASSATQPRVRNSQNASPAQGP